MGRSKGDLLMFYPVNNHLWIQEIPNVLNSFGIRILDLHTLECFHLIVEMTMTVQKCVPGILQIISTLNSKCRQIAILLHLYQVLLHLYQVQVLPNSNRIRSKEDLLMFYPVNNHLWIQEIPNILNSFGTKILDLHTLECF